MDQLPFQNRFRNLHVGVGRGANQSAHRYDVRYVPEDTGKITVKCSKSIDGLN